MDITTLHSRIPMPSLTELLRILVKKRPELSIEIIEITDKVSCRSVLPGRYTHLGFIDVLIQLARKCPADSTLMEIHPNVDGMSPFKASHVYKQLWPIWCRVISPKKTTPFLDGIYGRTDKSENVNDYLNKAVEELQLLMTNGFQTDDNHTMLVALSAVICNTLARNYVKRERGHHACYGCDRCKTEGYYCGGQTMENVKFSNGFSIQPIGLGTWTSPPDKIHTAVFTALEAGYRHIDTAYVYHNEAEIGAALEYSMSQLKLKREDIFITSKLWITSLRKNLVRGACEKSLKDLRLNYLDLYLIHWPIALQPGTEDFPEDARGRPLIDVVSLVDTWKEMEKLVDDGLVKSIGLSNFNKRQIDMIMSNCRIKPVNLQVEIHANFPNTKLTEYAQSLGMTVTAYSPLGSPESAPGRQNLLTESRVVALAKKYNRTTAQILLRYLLQRGIIVIPKSVTPERIRENFKVFDFSLTKEDIENLMSGGLNERHLKVLQYKDHPEYPFNDEY